MTIGPGAEPLEHIAVVGRVELRAVTASELIAYAVSNGERVVVVHAGVGEGSELVIALEEREVGGLGRTVELVHRSGGPAGVAEAAARTRLHGEGPLRLLVLEVDAGDGASCLRLAGRLAEPASLTCWFDAGPAAGSHLARVLSHGRLLVEGTSLVLGSAAERLLGIDLLLETLRGEDEIDRAVDAATLAGADGATVRVLADRHRRRIEARRTIAALRGEVLPMRRAVDAGSRQAAADIEIDDALGSADGDVDAMLAATAAATGCTILLEDPSFRILRWAEPELGTGPGRVEPALLSDLMTAGRLARTAAGLDPWIPSPVRLGTPSAGARMITRLGHRTLLGYVSALLPPDGTSEAATAWLRRLATPLAATLRHERDRSDVAVGIRTQVVRLLVAGTMGPVDAASAAAHVGWQRGDLAQVAAVHHAAGAAQAERVLEDLQERAHRLDLVAAVCDGYLAVLVNPLRDDARRLHELTVQAESTVIGFGSPVLAPMDAPRSFREASWAAQMAVVANKPSLEFEDLGIHRLLLPGAEAGDPTLERPIIQLELERTKLGFDPVQTLTVFLDAGASPTEAARRLNVHVNSLRYRLERIAAVAEIDLADPEQRFRAQLALRLRASRVVLGS